MKLPAFPAVTPACGSETDAVPTSRLDSTAAAPPADGLRTAVGWSSRPRTSPGDLPLVVALARVALAAATRHVTSADDLSATPPDQGDERSEVEVPRRTWAIRQLEFARIGYQLAAARSNKSADR